MKSKIAINKLMALYEKHGNKTYGESITQVQHAVQAGKLAKSDGASKEVILGAFFHDVGHLLVNEVEESQRDDALYRHQMVGAEFMKKLGFSKLIVDIITKHVDSKRYLVAVDGDYFDTLSPASVESLGFQGGAMNQAEIAEFSSLPDFQIHLKIRHWDDLAKDINKTDSNMEPFFAMAQEHLEECSAA